MVAARRIGQFGQRAGALGHGLGAARQERAGTGALRSQNLLAGLVTQLLHRADQERRVGMPGCLHDLLGGAGLDDEAIVENV